jgi:hypothetical protein
VSPPETIVTGDLTQYSALGHEIVILVVGAEKKLFTLHKKLLCDRSEYFSKAFGGQFKEAIEGRMELPNDTPAAIDCLVTWLYWDKMPTAPSFYGDAVEKSYNYCKTVLYAAYILAEKLCLHDMANKVMDKIQDFQYVTVPEPIEV